MQRSSTYRGLRSIVAAALIVLVWGASVAAQDVSRAKVATLLNLSPRQSWVHLFCEKTTQPGCCVTFWCGQRTGDPVTWDVEWEPGRIFTYWPGKTNPDGSTAGLEAALVVDAGLTPEAARLRTTCVLRSNDPVEVRAYTRIAGEIVPVANRATILQAAADAPADPAPSEWGLVLCL